MKGEYYFQDLPEEIGNEIFEGLEERIKKDKDHRATAKDSSIDLDDYAHEIVDDWINCNNTSRTITEWQDQVEEADI